MTWGVDYTSRVRADLVGLDSEVGDAITDLVVTWMAEGPPRDHERVLASFTFFEAPVADRYLLGYMVDDEVPGSSCCGCDVSRARDDRALLMAGLSRVSRDITERSRLSAMRTMTH